LPNPVEAASLPAFAWRWRRKVAPAAARMAAAGHAEERRCRPSAMPSSRPPQAQPPPGRSTRWTRITPLPPADRTRTDVRACIARANRAAADPRPGPPPEGIAAWTAGRRTGSRFGCNDVHGNAW